MPFARVSLPLSTATKYLGLAVDHTAANRRPGGRLEPVFAPSTWLWPELARLIRSHLDRETGEFRRIARRAVHEQLFVEDAGDPTIESATWREAEAVVEAAERAHRALRHRVVHAESRPGEPTDVPPLMHG